MAHPQRGAALITALLLLIVLTILGVSVMQMSRVQEKMAGNTRDSNVGFETAEGALRNAEALIRIQPDRPNTCTDNSCAYRTDELGDVANQNSAWWATNGEAFKDGSGSQMTGVADNPRYVIEQIALIPDVLDGGTDSGAYRTFYRVTARSTGASGLSNTIVQSTFARKD
jgi:type IV pilus assembly protein PilX